MRNPGAVFSKCGRGTPEALETLSGVWEIRTIFIITPRCYWPFSFSFSLENTVEFPRNDMTYNISEE